MFRLNSLIVLIILFCLGTATASDSLPEAAVFHIKVRVFLTLDYGLMQKKVSNSYSGSSVCVSPDGYLITNAHVADPESLVSQLISASTIFPRNVTDVTLQYYIENRDKIIFASDFRPEVEYSLNRTNFWVRIAKLDIRSTIEVGRTIHLIKSNSQDTMIVKVDYGAPLPFIKLPPMLPPAPKDKTQVARVIYALAARQTPDNQVVVISRIGETNDLPLTTVLRVKVKPITMTTLQGDSGAIIVDRNNLPLGLLSSHETQEYSNVSYMIPINAVANFYNTVMKDNKACKSNQPAEPLLESEAYAPFLEPF